MQGDLRLFNIKKRNPSYDEKELRYMFYDNPNSYPNSYSGNMQASEAPLFTGLESPAFGSFDAQAFGQSGPDAVAMVNYYAAHMQTAYELQPYEQPPAQFLQGFL